MLHNASTDEDGGVYNAEENAICLAALIKRVVRGRAAPPVNAATSATRHMPQPRRARHADTREATRCHSDMASRTERGYAERKKSC